MTVRAAQPRPLADVQIAILDPVGHVFRVLPVPALVQMKGSAPTARQKAHKFVSAERCSALRRAKLYRNKVRAGRRPFSRDKPRRSSLPANGSPAF